MELVILLYFTVLYKLVPQPWQFLAMERNDLFYHIPLLFLW